MRIMLATVAVLVGWPPEVSSGRLFPQMYGAVQPSGAGDDCHWNLNQDYFVPRYCDSARYGLYSACHVDRGISAACRNQHPLHPSYCTPYGACRYVWRDHVYKSQCGCTPHRCTLGPWKLANCPKHACVLRPSDCESQVVCRNSVVPHPCSCDAIGSPATSPNISTGCGCVVGLAGGDSGWAAVEPLGGDSLGTLRVDPLLMPGGVAGQAGGARNLPVGTPGLLESLGVPAPTRGLSLPGLSP